MSDSEEDSNGKRKRPQSDSSPEQPDPKKPQNMSISMEDFNNAFATLTEKVDESAKSLGVRFAAVEKAVDDVAKMFDKLKVEVAELHIKVNRQDLLINDLEQDALSSSFNIFGLPKIADRKIDPLPTVQKVIEKFGVETSSEDFKHVFYVQHLSGKSSHIAVTCWNENKKTEIMSKARECWREKKLKIFAEDIVELSETSPARGRQIIIRNQMTRTNAKIYNEARKLHKKQFEYVWEKNGRTMIRIRADSKMTHIRTLQQLAHSVEVAKQQMEH